MFQKLENVNCTAVFFLFREDDFGLLGILEEQVLRHLTGMSFYGLVPDFYSRMLIIFTLQNTYLASLYFAFLKDYNFLLLVCIHNGNPT